MTAQLAIDFSPKPIPEHLDEAPNKCDLDTRFSAWVERYPDVSQIVIRELRADLAAGRRLSVKAIVEDLRNGRRLAAPYEGGFAYNNSLTSRLNRLVAQLAPDLASHLETRRLSK